MTTTATRLARGEFDAPIPEGDDDEFGVLWRALKSLAAQLKARIGDLVEEGDRLQRLMTIRRDFVANVSHELRTPVTSIQGYAETLLRKDHRPETRTQFLEVIHRQAQRIGALVEQLLALSELEARGRDDLAREPVNVLAVATHVAETVARPRARRRKVTVDIDVVPEIEVLADPEGVERALLNLVDNAVKYGKEAARSRVYDASAAGEGGRSACTIVVDGRRRRHRGRASAAPLRALLPRRPGSLARARRRRPRPRDREAPRRVDGRLDRGRERGRQRAPVHRDPSSTPPLDGAGKGLRPSRTPPKQLERSAESNGAKPRPTRSCNHHTIA